jgi:predicted N-acetyltransferase YhbS
MTIAIRRLRPSDDRSEFRCGDIELDRFFQRYAGQNQFRHHLGTTYVAVDDAGRILGFATVSPSQIEVRDLPVSQARRLPRYPLPVLRLARFAVDEKEQRIGIGLLLLKSVFVLARRMAHVFGCSGVLVDAKPDAIAYYKRFGFFELSAPQGALGARPEPTLMFLELGAIPKTTDAPPGD